MNSSIIFCQAPLKIPSALNCYENEIAEGRSVTIVLRNTNSMFRFLQDLNLKAQVVWFDKLPFSIRDWKLAFRIVDNQLSGLDIQITSDTRVFFTDVNDDPCMGLYLKRLRHCEIVKIRSLLDIEKGLDQKISTAHCPLKHRMIVWIKSLVYGFPWCPKKIDHWTYMIDTTRLPYKAIDYSNSDVCDRYKVKLEVGGDHIVAFFTEPYRNKFQTKTDYDGLNVQIVNELHRRGYKVVVKGHPRIGCHEEARRLADYEIPSYVPSEFVDLHDFDFIVGFVSSSICVKDTTICSYSVLPLCEIVDSQEEHYWYDYMNKLSCNNIRYLKNFDEIIDYNNNIKHGVSEHFKGHKAQVGGAMVAGSF